MNISVKYPLMIESFKGSQKVLAGSDRSQIVLRGFRSFKRGNTF